MSGVLALGRIAGIRLRISYSWVILFALTVATLATSWFPASDPCQRYAGVACAGTVAYIGLGVIGALLLFFSVLAHEAAHVAFARYRNLPISRITLYPFGGVSDLEREPLDPGETFQLAAFGPLANFILAGIAASLQAAFLPTNYLAAALFGYLDAANVALGLFNLLPGFPLDGGLVLRALVARATKDAEKAASWSLLAGQVIAYLLMLWGIALFFVAGRDSAGAALWLVFLGWFLLSAARSESRQSLVDTLFQGVTVAEVMRPAPASIPASATLQQVVDEHVLAHGVRAAPVIKAGRFAGLITLADVLRAPREQWARTTAGAAMTPLDRLAVASPEQPVSQAVSLLAARDVNQLPVVRDGKVVGMLGRDALLSELAQRGPEPTAAERAEAAEEPKKTS
jgi:Zn-dependent protease/CBS domain-containing protein